MKNCKNKHKILILVVLAVFVGVSIFQLPSVNRPVLAISKICEMSPECVKAAEKEAKANEKAAQASNSADWYQTKVDELSAKIASKEVEIKESEARVKELKREIRETEKKLVEQQEALAELLVNMHFEGDTEPIKILAGASSISDLAEKAAREQVIKEQITTSANEVKKTKEKLEDDKIEVEDQLDMQKTAKEDMAISRQEQQDLVKKYENDKEAYAEEAKAAQAEQRAAMQAYQEAHPEIFRGSAYSGGINSYPWQADCPGKQDAYLTYWQDASGWHKIGGFVCECVSYAGWKAYEAYGVAPAWGHAYSWASGARAAGYRVDNTPAAGTIGQIGGAPYGHVFWVESVNGDGSINVTEYNNAYATGLYFGDQHYGDFGARVIPAYEVGQYNYIHFR